jgi:uncharacterized protein (DUF2147 family)
MALVYIMRDRRIPRAAGCQICVKPDPTPGGPASRATGASSNCRRDNAMKKLLFFVVGIFVLLVMCPSAQAQNADAILGTWLNGDQDAHIDIYKTDGQYFGKIVWLKNPVYPADDKKGMAGKTKVDRENPDPAKRTRPTLGLVILRNFVYGNGNVWEKGQVYDPKSGKDYKCKLTLRNPDTLDVRGFVGFSLFGRTDTWTRVK